MIQDHCMIEDHFWQKQIYKKTCFIPQKYNNKITEFVIEIKIMIQLHRHCDDV